MRGRKPTPRAIKAVKGNPGNRELGTDPDVRMGIPSCPEHLDDCAREEWGRVAVELSDAGLLAHVDRAALAAYCQAWSRWVAAEEMISAHGMLAKTPNGFVVQSPVLAIANRAMEHMKGFMTEFGMTPVSRARVDAQKGAADDEPGAEFFGLRAVE